MLQNHLSSKLEIRSRPEIQTQSVVEWSGGNNESQMMIAGLC